MNLLEQEPQPSEPEYRLIPLTQGQFAIVDAADFEWLNQWKWYAWRSPHTGSFYAMRAGKDEMGEKIGIYMARMILGAKRGEQVDHGSHNTLDNRRSKIRIATSFQNSFNHRKRKNSRSPYKGVYQNRHGRWSSEIQANGIRKWIGNFATAEDAHEAYKKAAVELHGEFACFE